MRPDSSDDFSDPYIQDYDSDSSAHRSGSSGSNVAATPVPTPSGLVPTPSESSGSSDGPVPTPLESSGASDGAPVVHEHYSSDDIGPRSLQALLDELDLYFWKPAVVDEASKTSLIGAPPCSALRRCFQIPVPSVAPRSLCVVKCPRFSTFLAPWRYDKAAAYLRDACHRSEHSLNKGIQGPAVIRFTPKEWRKEPDHPEMLNFAPLRSVACLDLRSLLHQFSVF